jgi:hypothetical protein
MNMREINGPGLFSGTVLIGLFLYENLGIQPKHSVSVTKTKPATRSLFLNSECYMVICDFHMNQTKAKELCP